jgi:hypothetical protein
VSNSNSKKKQTDGLIPVKTNICNDGDEGDMSFMGSPPLLPSDDPAEYKKLRRAASKSMPADFLGQFCGRMLTDALWETRRYQLVATNIIKADLSRYPEIEDPQAKVAHVVMERLDALERLYRIIGSREHRVDAIHRLAEQHRNSLGRLLPSTAEQIQDAEFQEVDDNAADGHKSNGQPAHED